MLARSYLYVPADNQRFLDKTAESIADVFILDLEDSVNEERKEIAEGMLREFLKSTSENMFYLRVEPRRMSQISDLINHSKISRIVMPKSNTTSALEELNRVNESNKPIHALIESPLGLENIKEIALSKNVVSLGIGEADFYSTLSLSEKVHRDLKSFVRSKLVVTSAAYGLNPPIAPVSSNFTDKDSFRRESEELLDWGYWGRACIHPAQVEIANEVFTIGAEVKSKAEKIMEAMRRSDAGATTDRDGAMIDKAHLAWATRILEM
jgi:citrate lyase subunit beta/citryl-CoA lyase